MGSSLFQVCSLLKQAILQTVLWNGYLLKNAAPCFRYLPLCIIKSGNYHSWTLCIGGIIKFSMALSGLENYPSFKLENRQTEAWWFLSLTGQSGLTVLAPRHPACVCGCVWVCVSEHIFETDPVCTKLRESPAHWPEQPLLWDTVDWVWQGKQCYVVRGNYTHAVTFCRRGVSNATLNKNHTVQPQ